MIESIENAVQLALLLVCTAVSGAYAVRSRERSGAMLTLFYGSYALGDLYWLLYLMFYGHTPKLFYVSDLSWYAAYLFLYLLLQLVSDSEERRTRCPAVYLLPLFTVVMCVFYMQWGDYVGNVIAAVLMSLLLTHAARGLCWLRRHPEDNARRWLYIVTFVFCLVEYAAWTASCFWAGDTWANPYFWFDCLLTLITLLFLPAYRKGVSA